MKRSLPRGDLSPLTHFQCGEEPGAIGSVFGHDVEDGIGLAGALDAVVDEVMPGFGALSGGDFLPRSVGAYDARGGKG